MRKRNKMIIAVAACLLAAAGVNFSLKLSRKSSNGEKFKEVSPVRGRIEAVISTTGMVLPKNRLEIKPPVNGRVEEIMVHEGQKVKAGDTLARMSSTERAALMDAARGKGEGALAYWQQAYKPIPLVSPIDGEVIVAKTQPGQTITTADAVVVLSDHLIARAQVDETDIGKVREGQEALISLDAYAEQKIKGVVEHIYHESKTVNNVTIYEVDVIPEEVQQFFRSGMNANIDLKYESADNALLLPQEAVSHDKEGSWVLLEKGRPEPVRTRVQTGLSDAKNVEITSGLGDGDTVVVKEKKYSLPKNQGASNPFSPFRPRQSSR
jgi:macrolide-specific efflux system membrane fusion protein